MQVHCKVSAEVPEVIRAMIRDLYCLENVPMQHVFPVAKRAWEAAGLTVVGSFSAALVALCVREGGFLARLQVVEELQSAQAMVLSSDGTNDRALHYQAYHTTMKKVDGDIRTLFLGFRRQAHHTSEQQLLDWERQLTELRDLWNASPLGQVMPVTLDFLLALCVGTNMDHAAEMKKLNRLLQELKRRVDRLTRGYEVIDALNDLQYQSLAADVLQQLIREAGGDAVWDSLPAEKQQELYDAGLDRIAQQLGEQKFSELPAAVQARVDLWFWFGCTMHKELNAIKAGSNRMATRWSEIGATPPMKFLNKDNKAAASSGSAAAKARAEAVSQAGGAKLAFSLGQLFRNKDPGKGYQRTFNNFMYEELGFGEKHGFTNLEQNCYAALQDAPTRTETAVLAVCHVVLSMPYVAATRAPGVNATSLGPLHVRVVSFCRQLAADPSLLLDRSPTVSHVDCTLNGEPYEEIDVIYAVLDLYHEGKLPHFQDILSAFFEGCASKFEDFTEEFAEDSPLSRAAPEDLDRVFFPATNDRNECALAQLRDGHRDAANITDSILNAKLSYKLNDTSARMQDVTPETLSFVRRKAREEEAASRRRRDDTTEAAHFKQTAHDHYEDAMRKAEEARKERNERTDRLDKLELDGLVIRDIGEVQQRLDGKKFTVNHIEEQLEWHRWRGLPHDHPDKPDMIKARYPKKEDKIRALTRAITALRAIELAEAATMPVSIDDVFLDVPYVDTVQESS
ncbi:hypothetical protein AURDEDRAFT_77246 [Auricularia subglabra TFB-10046 SS5]|uniref:Uncharacterized protein n=1 Tax=Auricularia subglabra (strain TFB-10046 / SS5) TaxID=717982 RepID=J0D317_AURST|nr:hypothetical protein AURDEDRAFT_77246 [Auricularia subglabra TFB-10046 SS5]